MHSPTPLITLALAIATMLITPSQLHAQWAIGPIDCKGSADHAKVKSSTKSAASPVNPAIKFALRMHQAIAADDVVGNIASSPSAVYAGLHLLREGAAGKTRSEFDRLLGFTDTKVARHAIELRRSMLPFEPQTIFEQKIGFWVFQRNDFSTSFRRSARRDHDAVLGTSVFMSREPGRLEMNEWIANASHGRIHNMLSEKDVSDVWGALVSVIYLKAQWADPFDAPQTKPGEFHLDADQSTAVPFMHKKHHLAYAETEALQAIRLPLGLQHEFEFIALLPKADSNVIALERALTAESWEQLLKSFTHPEVVVSMPKFAMSLRSDIGYALRGMGLKACFTRHADFSPMLEAKVPLQIGSIPQALSIDIDERGIEAAASVVADIGYGAMANPPPPKIFTADRPFLYVVRHIETGSLILLGRVTSPAPGNASAD